MTTTDHDPLAGYDTFGIDLSGATAARRADSHRATLRPMDDDEPDTSSSESRQHYIDTGRYLTRGETRDAR